MTIFVSHEQKKIIEEFLEEEKMSKVFIELARLENTKKDAARQLDLRIEHYFQRGSFVRFMLSSNQKNPTAGFVRSVHDGYLHIALAASTKDVVKRVHFSNLLGSDQ